MEKIKREQTDEEAQSIENGDGINEGIYSLTYDQLFMEDYYEKVSDELSNILEYIGYMEHLVTRFAKAEKNLSYAENQIIGSIGKDLFMDMMDLIYKQQLSLEGEISVQNQKYDNLKLSIKNPVNNDVKNKEA
jgi:hypothetical protein